MNNLPPHPEQPSGERLPSLGEILSGTLPLLDVYLGIEDATPAELRRACAAVHLSSARAYPAGVETPPSADSQRALLRTVVQQRYARELQAALDSIPPLPAELLHPQHFGPPDLVALAIDALQGERSAYLTADPADRLRLLDVWVWGGAAGVDPARFPELAGLTQRSLEICVAAEIDGANHRRGLLLARHHGVVNRRLGEETDALIHLGAGRSGQAAVLPHHYWVSTPTSMELALGLR